MQKNAISKTNFYTLFIYIFSLLLLPSCATEQWYQAERECRVVGDQYYPPNIQRMLVTKTYWVDVMDGYDCLKNKQEERCHVHNKRVPQYYQAWEDIDINVEARHRYVDYCVAEVCKQRYGNVDCEVKNINK